MKVLMINSVCGIRSTGRICTDISSQLVRAGHECRIAYGREAVPAQYEQFALCNYASSIVTFMVPVMQLGFRATLVQELIEAPEKEGQILGTAVTLNIIASFACIAGIFSFTSIVNRGEPETIVVCALYSISLIFQAMEMIQYWFQAKLLSKYTSVTMLISYFVVSAYKILLLITEKNVYWFAVAYSIDYSIISSVLFVMYFRVSGVRLSFSWELGKNMLQKSKYYILSGLMVTVFQQTDRIMLKLMIDNETTAFYSAAISCAGLTSFVYQAIIDSARPMILESKLHNQAEYEKKLSRLYSVVIWLSIAQSVVLMVFAELIVRIIYSAEYLPAVDVLQVGVWFVTFSYIGTVRNVWILAEKKQNLLLSINLSGAVVNVLLIPVSISLIISWIMIGVIIHIYVMDRTKKIGIL